MRSEKERGPDLNGRDVGKFITKITDYQIKQQKPYNNSKFEKVV